MAAAQVRVGKLLQKRSVPSIVKVGDKVWLDSRHTPIDIPYKLTAQWFGPFVVTAARGAQVILDLPDTFGKAHRRVNIRRLEERDEAFGDSNIPPRPMVGVDGVEKFEIRRISNSRTYKG